MSGFLLKAFAKSHVGNVRENNEDNLFFFGNINEKYQNEIAFFNEADSEKATLFGVFDGMGGQSYGEIASYECAKLCQDYILHENFLLDDLKAICHIANERVCAKMHEMKARMGSTASMLALHQNTAYICNMGDSPIYLYRNHQLSCLYEEHTERKMMEKLYGASDSKKKYRLTQHIGVFSSEVMIQPFCMQMEIEEGDIFLICSDGLSDMVSEEEIGAVLDTFDENSIEILEDLSLRHGGRDNITMILMQIGKKEEN